jgi:hypothetical protein
MYKCGLMEVKTMDRGVPLVYRDVHVHYWKS